MFPSLEIIFRRKSNLVHILRPGTQECGPIFHDLTHWVKCRMLEHVLPVGFWNAMGVPTQTVRRCQGGGGVRHNGPQFCVNSMMMVDHHMIYSWEMIEASRTHKWERKNLGLLRGGFLSSHDQIIKFLPTKSEQKIWPRKFYK
jgi:hypothetical protein